MSVEVKTAKFQNVGQKHDEYCMWKSLNKNALILEIRSGCPYKIQKTSNIITENNKSTLRTQSNIKDEAFYKNSERLKVFHYIHKKLHLRYLTVF